jgi:hypothetical protein
VNKHRAPQTTDGAYVANAERVPEFVNAFVVRVVCDECA